jgi:nitrate/nitrite transporter NarK
MKSPFMPQEKTGSFRTLVLWILMVSTQFQVFNFTVFVTEMIKDLSLTYTQAGLFQSALFLPYAIVQVFSGGIADRFSTRKLLVTSSILMTASSVLFGIAPTFYELLVLRAIMGMCLAVIFVVSVRFVLRSADPSRMGRGLGVYLSSLALGPFIAAVAPAFVSNFTSDWRTAVFALNLVGLIPILLLILSPIDFRITTITHNPKQRETLSSILKRKETWVLGYDQLLRFGVGASLSAWIPTFMIQVHGFSRAQSGVILGGAWAFAMISIPLGGLLADIAKRKFLVIELAILGLIPSILLFGFVSEYYLTWIMMLIVGAFMYLHFGPLFTVLPDMYDRARLGLVTGIQGSMGACGAFILPAFVGYLKDTTGAFSSAWYMISIMAFVGAIISISLRRF